MKPTRTNGSVTITRRQAVNTTGKALAGLATLPFLPHRVVEGQLIVASVPASEANQNAETTKRLKVATCQFPVSGSPAVNAKYIAGFMHEAAAQGAHLLHTSEASLSGYAGYDVPTLSGYNWDALRKATTELRAMAKELRMWLALGSTHFLDEKTKPTNCIYLIDPEAMIVDRYDKSFCTSGDQKHYSAGNRLVTRDIRGVKIGLAICFDLAWPQLYIAYRELGVTVMIHSFHNAREKGPNCLDVLDSRLAPTRCSDNRMWAVCNNSSQPYSHWGSFIARPDGTIPKQLAINQPGMIIHEFPDTLSEGGWYHNFRPMRKRDDEIMNWGTPSEHPRQRNGQSEP